MEKWDTQTIQAFRKTLLDWYDSEGRAHLPWRENHEPYRVLLSEIMLQQTQVNTVLPYFERFVTALPTVEALANAPEEQVLKLWEGLGYYSRARNLQKAAKYVVNELGGVWPTNSAGLLALPGVGPYTAAAIGSISFNEAVPAVDGNAFRVFSRLLKIDADIAQPKTRQLFYDALLPIVDPARPGDFNQAIMDLGSTYMTAKNWDVEHSPVKAFDASYRDGVVEIYPVKSKKVKSQTSRHLALALLDDAGNLLVQQRPSGGLLADLWLMPLVEFTQVDAAAQAHDAAKELFDLDIDFAQLNIKPVVHVFTHRRWEILVMAANLTQAQLAALPGKRLAFQTAHDVALPTVEKKLEKVIATEWLDTLGV
ncbi:MAG TPA: A/G-specific adenine glycosylase [Lactobacillaceae bacterium]|jgi:A/G-specific adenine glycosylase